MKKIATLLLVPFSLFLTSLSCQADTGRPAGIYSSYADFVKNRLTHPVDLDKPGDRLSADRIASGKIAVTTGGQKKLVAKDEVYGYRIGDKAYRLYKGQAYEVVDTAGFYLYYRFDAPRGGKIRVATSPSGYYFSTRGDNTIQHLTIANLENAFPANSSFRYKMAALFSSDKDLPDYDRLGKQYAIKHVYLSSL